MQFGIWIKSLITTVQWERNTSARPRRLKPSGYVTKVIHIRVMKAKPEFLKKKWIENRYSVHLADDTLKQATRERERKNLERDDDDDRRWERSAREVRYHMICFCWDRGFSAAVVRVRTFWECRKGGIRSDNLILSCRTCCLALSAEKSELEIICPEAWFLVFFSDHIPRTS